MRQVVTLEPIPLPDVRRPAKLTSLPQWVEERLAILGKEMQSDQTGRYREVSTLPTGQILEASQKAIVARHIASLGELQKMTPETDDAHAKPTLIAVSKMLMTLAGREAGDLGGAAKGEAYMAALDDVAFWAVEEASRRWYRGEYGDGHDYRWMPAPATLRELAKLEEWRVKAVASKLQRLVDAKPALEFSQEHKANMKARLKEYGIGA